MRSERAPGNGDGPGLCGSANPSNDFFFFNKGVISFGTGFGCLNVLGGVTQTGRRLGWWNGNNCQAGVVNQTFTLGGPIHALGQCVNMEGGVPFNGVGIGMFPCQNNNQAPNELWEFYW